MYVQITFFTTKIKGNIKKRKSEQNKIERNMKCFGVLSFVFLFPTWKDNTCFSSKLISDQLPMIWALSS